MTRVILWSAVATVAAVAGVLGVVHTLLRYAMTARGLRSWRVADTVLTSPLLWLGVTLVAAALSWLLTGAALRVGRPDAAGGSAALVVAMALVGAAMVWFGLRAVGKLY